MKPTPLLLTTDTVLFGFDSNEVKHVLLIQRKNPPYQLSWALPGGFVDPGEDLPDAAKRELLEETNVEVESLTQFGAYGNPNRDSRGRVVTIAYTALVRIEDYEPKALDDAANIGWFDLEELPPLAFDHQHIIEDALKVS